MTITRTAGSSIQVITRAAEILRAVAGEAGGLSQAELGERLALPRTTVHRIVNALEAEGLLQQPAGASRYRPGPEITRIAAATARASFVQLREQLAQLSGTLGETVDLSILQGTGVRFLDQVIAPNRLQAVSAIGEQFPLHCCAPGKAILSALVSNSRVDYFPTHLSAMTPKTIISAGALRRELAAIAESGVAFDREEHTLGICAVATVLDPDAEAPMAISVPMPAQRFYGREEELIEAIGSARDVLTAQREPVRPLP